jgi:hypothetical protein
VGVALLHLPPQVDRRLRFGLPDATPHPQARFRFNRRAAPVFAGLVRFYTLFFAPLRPT